MKRWTGLPVLVLAAGLGCSEGPSAPTSGEPASIRGQVIDADSTVPIVGAVVSTDTTQVTTDGNGEFTLVTTLPTSWLDVTLKVTRPGYETLRQQVQRTNASSARLAAYRTLTIRPGESIRVNLVQGVDACGSSLNCRRVAVVQSATGVVDIEVAGDNGPLSLNADRNPVFDTDHPAMLSVSRSEVWVLGVGTGTLKSEEAGTLTEPASIRGEIIDVDSSAPIAGAVISTDTVCSPGRCAGIDNPDRVIAYGNGEFTLNTKLPLAWREVMLNATQTGYEPVRQYVQRADANRARLRAYPTLTIRPGESIRVNFAGIDVCGWLSISCRRIAVVLPASGVVDIEVTGDIRYLGLSPDGNPFFDSNFPTVLSVSRNEVWILGGSTGFATLTARER